MNDILNYNGYEGTVEVDMSRGVCRGRILFVCDLTYESDTPKGLQHAFEEAVDDYLETCRELGRNPHKPARGSFNVRTPSDLHRDAQRRALVEGVGLNDIVVRSLECYLHSRTEITNHNYVLVSSDSEKEVITAAISNDSTFGVGTSVRH